MSYQNCEEIEMENNNHSSSNSNNDERYSVTSSASISAGITAKLQVSLNEIEKANAKIKKQLQHFPTLEKGERQIVRDLLQNTIRTSDYLQKQIQFVEDENMKLKFENLLSKKVKNLQQLSENLVYREKELLDKYQDQLEDHDIEDNLKKYEKKGLLDDSDSDEDAKYYKKINKAANKTEDDYESKGKYSDYVDDEAQSSQQAQQLQQEDDLEEFKLDSHDQFVRARTQKITKVASSMVQIHKMYETLNQIVFEQGETLTRLEHNVGGSKNNVKKGVQELKKALDNEKSVRDRLCGCDFGIMCLSIWFIVMVIFFMLDVSISPVGVNNQP